MDSETAQEDSVKFSCNNCLVNLKLFEEESTAAAVQVAKKYLTKCYHVLCQNCYTQSKNQCAACGKTTQFMVISRNMPEEYQWWFEPFAKLQSYVDDVTNFQRSQDELIQSLMNDKSKQRVHQVKQAVNATKQELDATKAKAHKMKIAHDIIVTEKQRREENKNKPWMVFDETPFMAENKPSEQREVSKDWIEFEQPSTQVRNKLPAHRRSSKDRRRFGHALTQAQSIKPRRHSKDRQQIVRPTQAHVKAPRRSSKDHREIAHPSSHARNEFPDRRRSKNINIETSTNYGDVLAHKNRLPEFKTPESFGMTLDSDNSLQTHK